MRSLTHLERLEAESIHIFREVVAEASSPLIHSSAEGATSLVVRDGNRWASSKLLVTGSCQQGCRIDMGHPAAVKDKETEGHF